MAEESTQPKKLQWKWVWISLLLYAVFYLVPLFFFAYKVEVLLFVWMFAGIIVIAAVAGYLSPGVTIAEPACTESSITPAS